ncbi:MAG: diacylglycerol kinase family protein [Candidatus Sericytochromatia bacterium]|nr:diacylglycerol kinase family protein [Candidatus Sericytochromatia bacterium]
MSVPFRPLVLVNPAARRGARRGLLEDFLEGLALPGAVGAVPRSRDESLELMRGAAARGHDALVVVSGDGGLNAAIMPALEQDLPVAVCPAGTANDWARHIGMPRHPWKAGEALRVGRVAQVDVLEVEGRPFLTGGGVGAVAAVAESVNRAKARSDWLGSGTRAMGALAYLVHTVGIVAGNPDAWQDWTIEQADGLPDRFRSLAIFVHNVPTIGRFVRAVPDARPDDGTLRLMALLGTTRAGILRDVGRISLPLPARPFPPAHQAVGSAFTLSASRPFVFHGDGEPLAAGSSLSFAIRPAALKVWLPGGSGLRGVAGS